MDTWRDVAHTSNLNELITKGEKVHFCQEPAQRERQEGERRERFHILSKIYGTGVVISVRLGKNLEI